MSLDILEDPTIQGESEKTEQIDIVDDTLNLNEDEQDDKTLSLIKQKKHFREKAEKFALENELLKKEIEEKSKALETQVQNDTRYQQTKEFETMENELSNKHHNWEFMDEGTREALRIAYNTQKDLEVIKNERAEVQRQKQFDIEIEQLARENGFSIADFKQFATQDKYKNVSVEVLAELFDTKQSLEKPVRKGLETSTGNNRTSKPANGMTAKEVERLMATDPKRFNELMKRGMVNIID